MIVCIQVLQANLLNDFLPLLTMAVPLSFSTKGIIPKENINVSRYFSVPADPDVKDVSHVSKVLNRVTATMFLLNSEVKLLRDRLSAIVDDVHLWARNVHDFSQGYIAKTNEVHEEVLILENNLDLILTEDLYSLSS